ncbi:unnamed protein product [Caenorhabditis angaria]|uniref:C-type lectin domain-containing protein n=1 Tax=Caenorhabditis angaria TaxID=860376 RepID=A0A9P1INK4_9PELO|nr:unnamed protein product [Caenorhabditis angaria]
MMLISFFVLFAAISSTTFAQCPSSTDNYITDLCYKIVTTPASYNDARNNCHNQGYNLAVLHSGMQGNFLASLVSSAIGTNENVFWIGLSRPSSSSKFFWDDGSSVLWTYWQAGFPSGFNQAAESTANARWKTIDASEPHAYVCSYDPRKGTVTPVIPQSTPSYTDVTGGPTEVPSTINYGSTDVPSTVSYGSTDVPSTINYGSTDVPSTINYGSTDVPSTINYGSTDVPSTIPPSTNSGTDYTEVPSTITSGYQTTAF